MSWLIHPPPPLAAGYNLHLTGCVCGLVEGSNGCSQWWIYNPILLMKVVTNGRWSYFYLQCWQIYLYLNKGWRWQSLYNPHAVMWAAAVIILMSWLVFLLLVMCTLNLTVGPVWFCLPLAVASCVPLSDLPGSSAPVIWSKLLTHNQRMPSY